MAISNIPLWGLALTADTTNYPTLTKGGSTVQTDVVTDNDGNVITPSSYTLSNVSFPLGTTPTGAEFNSFDFSLEDGTTLTNVALEDLTLSSTPINDLAIRIQEKIRSALNAEDPDFYDTDRVNKITVTVINGKDLKIIDASGLTNLTGFTLNPATATASTVSTGGKNFAISAFFITFSLI